MIPHTKRQTRTAVACACAAVVATLIAACVREDADDPVGTGEAVVLYSSADPDVVRVVVNAFEANTGIRVKVAGDTEATKTTGLATRLRTEHNSGRPQAEVWWSSEPFWTIRLAEEEIFIPYTSESAEASVDGGWPIKSSDGTWYGFAQRARVFVFNTNLVQPDDVPQTLEDLTKPIFRGRVGIAQPEFGTTRGHMAAIAAVAGTERFERWLRALKANDVYIYNGNMAVVRGVANGEVLVGLTDTDDVWNGQRNQWPIAHAYETRADADPIEQGMGPLVIPNTCALVQDTPNARRLLDFLLSAECERIIGATDSHNVPVNPALRDDFMEYAIPDPATVDLGKVATFDNAAMDACRRTILKR